MEIQIGKYAGFCPGVMRAVNTVERLIKEGAAGQISTLGMLIHNRTVTEELAAKGVKVISVGEIEEIFAKAQAGQKQTIVLRAHGVQKQLFEDLVAKQELCPLFCVVDCTCTYVKKIHKIVTENTVPEGRLIVFGSPEHPEVQGICSYAKGDVVTVQSAEELKRKNLDDIPTIMVSQTTQKLFEWENCQKVFKNLCTNSKIFDTICSVTENRQREAVELCKQCDAVLVIGSKESSNTMKLYDIAMKNAKHAYLAEGLDDLPEIPLSVFTVHWVGTNRRKYSPLQVAYW